MQTVMKLVKTTKNTARYEAEDTKNEGGGNVCNTVYVNLSAFAGSPPKEITVTLEAAAVNIS